MKNVSLVWLAFALLNFKQDSVPTYKLLPERNAAKSEIKFVKSCLCQPNISELFGLDSRARHSMGFDTVHVIEAEVSIKHQLRSSSTCTGIYYYKLYFSGFSNGKIRGAERFRVFCILNKKLVTFSRDTVANQRIYTAIEPQLIQALGLEKTRGEKKYLIQGGAYFN